jgi:hypothetical protein
MAGETAEGGTLHADLVEMLEATRDAERAIYGLLDPDVRDAPRTIGDWSAKDVLAHLASWREVETERLRTGWRDRQAAGTPGSSPENQAGETEDDVNARVQAERASWSWERVAENAEASIDALEAAIAATSAETLQRSDNAVAGIGANGANHALGHLPEVADLAGADAAPRLHAFERRIEAILGRGRIADRDVGVMIYNLACMASLAGRLDDARRLITDALRRRPDLRGWALEDPDLKAIRDEIPGLAGQA